MSKWKGIRPRLTFRIPAELLMELRILSDATTKPVNDLMVEAVTSYVKLSKAKKESAA